MANIIESFDGANGSAPAGLLSPGTGIIDIQSNQLRIVSGPESGAESFWARAGLANGDLTINVRCATTEPQTFDILLRSSEPDDFDDCYVVRIDVSSSRFDFIMYEGGVEDEMLITAFTWVPGVQYKVRVQFNGTALKAKAWRSADPEPGAWAWEATDATFTTAGYLGLAVRSWAGERTSMWDNLQVVDLDASGGSGIAWASKGDTLGGAESGTALIPVPAGVGPGDIVIVDLYKENNRDVTNSSGFEPVGPPTATGGTDNEHHHQFWKRSTGVEPAAGYTFQYSTAGLTGPQTWRSGVANRYIGCDPVGNPIEAVNTASDPGDATPSPQVSLTTAGPNRLLVWSATVSDYATATPPTGFTERVDDGFHIAVATKLLETAGPTGNVIGSFSVATPRTARLIALRPASTGPVAGAPVVGAGTDATIELGQSIARIASVDDAGSTITSMSWKIQSGPSGVGTTLSTAAALSWTPTVTGVYVIRFTAENGVSTTYDEATVTVNTPTAPPALEEPVETVELDPRSWYLGPLGDLRELDTPETVSPTQVKYAGTHQGLSGAVVEDFNGVKEAVQLDFEWLFQDDYYWLNSINTRHVPGPYYLRNPLYKNRLSPTATRLTVGEDLKGGIQTFGFFATDRDIPEDAPLAGRSITIADWEGTTLPVLVDGNRPVPAFPGERVTGSIYLKSDSPYEGLFFFRYYDKYGTFMGFSDVFDVEVSNEWTRHTITYVTPEGVAGMNMQLLFGEFASSGLKISAPQLESGPEATAWEPGGGMPQVLVSEYSASSPRYPWWEVSITFREA